MKKFLIGRFDGENQVGGPFSNDVLVDCPSCKSGKVFPIPPYVPYIPTTWKCADCECLFSNHFIEDIS